MKTGDLLLIGAALFVGYQFAPKEAKEALSGGTVFNIGSEGETTGISGVMAGLLAGLSQAGAGIKEAAQTTINVGDPGKSLEDYIKALEERLAGVKIPEIPEIPEIPGIPEIPDKGTGWNALEDIINRISKGGTWDTSYKVKPTVEVSPVVILDPSLKISGKNPGDWVGSVASDTAIPTLGGIALASLGMLLNPVVGTLLFPVGFETTRNIQSLFDRTDNNADIEAQLTQREGVRAIQDMELIAPSNVERPITPVPEYSASPEAKKAFGVATNKYLESLPSNDWSKALRGY